MRANRELVFLSYWMTKWHECFLSQSLSAAVVKRSMADQMQTLFYTRSYGRGIDINVVIIACSSLNVSLHFILQCRLGCTCNTGQFCRIDRPMTCCASCCVQFLSLHSTVRMFGLAISNRTQQIKNAKVGKRIQN